MSKYNKLINIDIEGKNILIREDLNVPTKDNRLLMMLELRLQSQQFNMPYQKEQN